jgi:hypothetical protein
MFYCEPCAEKFNLGTAFWLPRSFGPCELCGTSSACIDVPSGGTAPEPQGGVIIADEISKEIMEKIWPDLSGKVKIAGVIGQPEKIKHKDRYELLKDPDPS